MLQEPAPSFLDELSPTSETVPRVKRPVYVHFVQALLVAIHLPVAVSLPLAAVVYSLRSIAWFLGVALASETRRQSFSEPLGMLLPSCGAVYRMWLSHAYQSPSHARLVHRQSMPVCLDTCKQLQHQILFCHVPCVSSSVACCELDKLTCSCLVGEDAHHPPAD